MFRYTRRKSMKKFMKAKMAAKKKTTYTRRYRPKVTTRRQRKYKRACGESSVLFGSSFTQPQKLNQLFFAGGSKWDQDGAAVSDASLTMATTNLLVAPSECIGLQERANIYKYFKITGVEYQFYKDSLSPNNGAYATANYTGEWDNKHSKMVYNYAVNGTPNITAYTPEAGEWISQQNGRMLPTLNGRKKKYRCKPYIRVFRTVNVFGSSGTDVSHTERYPWLNIESDLNKNLDTGNVDCWMPEVTLTPLLQGAASTYDLTTDTGRTQFSAPFQWYVRAKISWAVKGKFYKSDLAFPPSGVDEVDAMDNGMDNLEIN